MLLLRPVEDYSLARRRRGLDMAAAREQLESLSVGEGRHFPRADYRCQENTRADSKIVGAAALLTTDRTADRTANKTIKLAATNTRNTAGQRAASDLKNGGSTMSRFWWQNDLDH